MTTTQAYQQRQTAAGARQVADSNPPPQPECRGGRTLVIDDDPMQSALLGRMLESLGCFVEQRNSAVGVGELIAAEPGRFDFIVSDLEMPDMDGAELARELARLENAPPLLLCTGAASIPHDVFLVTAGVLHKPYTRSDLQAAASLCMRLAAEMRA